MILGDSAAFGHGVENDQTFSAYLEKILREEYPNKDIRTINTPVGGYSTFQVKQLLQDKGWMLTPDIKIVAVNNDQQAEWVED